MKKFTLLLISVFALQALFSQPTLTSSHNYDIGDTYRYDLYTDVTNIDPGAGGVNQVWDFGTIPGGTYQEGDGSICVDPSTTPFADSAAVLNANICIRSEDDPGDSPYQYIECNNTSQSLIAFGMSAGGSSYSPYTNPQTALEFPFTFGDSFDDTWESMMFYFDLGHYLMRDSSIVSVEADGYGTVTTPVGVFQNVLRVKRTTIDYSWSNPDGTGWISNGSSTYTQYEWYASNIKTPVIIMLEMEWMPGSYTVRYLVEYDFTVGIEDNIDMHLEIFPNPTTDRVTIKTDRTFNSINIYSLNGRQMEIVKSQTGQPLQYSIDLSRYPKGVYLIEVGFEDGNVVRERIIKQ